MSCRRSEGIDLDAFLLGVGEDAAVEAFRAHYPSCAECAAVVADWMLLEGVLRDVMTEQGEQVSAHPDPDALARFCESAASGGASGGGSAMQIERHLAGCPSCANEVRMIRAFDPAVFALQPQMATAAVPVRRRAEPGLVESLRETVVGWFEQMREQGLFAPAPAFALAAALVVAALWATGAFDRLAGGSSTPPQIVEQPAPSGSPPPNAPAPEPSGALPGVIGTPESTELAAQPQTSEPTAAETTTPRQAEAPVAPDGAASAPAPIEVAERAPERAPIEVAQAERAKEPAAIPPSGSQPGRPADSKTAPAPAGGDEIVLAAVNELPPPDYATPSGSESLVWMRQFGAARSAPSEAHVAARAPRNHTGITLSRAPRLWWALDKPTDHPIQITIDDGESIEPLLRVELPGPHTAGLHAFDLTTRAVELAPGVDYRWFVAIVVDPDRPSRNPVSVGSLRVASPSDGRRATISSAPASARGNKFAELGLWYDAYDFYASLAAAHPEIERLATYRDRLVEGSSAKP